MGWEDIEEPKVAKVSDTVKNINTLNDSLHKLITPEKIEDFKCSNCNKNVTINKRTTLSDYSVTIFSFRGMS